MGFWWGIMNGKTILNNIILNKIKRCEPLSEKEIEYCNCKKWYENLKNEYIKSEIQTEKELYARSKLEQMLKEKGL